MPARSGSARLDRWDGLLLILGALDIALFLAAEHRIAGPPGLPLDDGWIHLRLAQNLATGGGLAINPGEHRSKAVVTAARAPSTSVAGVHGWSGSTRVLCHTCPASSP